MTLWKIFYGAYDLGALIITVIGLAAHALRDAARRQ